MAIAANHAPEKTGRDPQGGDPLDRVAESMRAGSGVDLPHAYFVEEARRLLSGGIVHHPTDHHTRPEQLQSSACFDAWAKDDEDPADIARH